MLTIKHYLEKRYDFRYNVITGAICYRRKEDSVYKDFDNKAEKNFMVNLEEDHIPYSKQKLDILLHSDFSKPHNPIQEYLDGLQWDRKDHFSELASKVCTDDDEFFSVALKKFLSAAVAGWCYDGFYNEHMLVLNGGQGVGKSTFVSSLIPSPLTCYKFQGSMLQNLNDFMKQLSQKMFIVLDEFDSIRGRQIPMLKELITREIVETRLAYHKHDMRKRRIASFIATTNVAQPLGDTSGGRRFLVFTVKKIDWSRSVDIDQVYAQVYEQVKLDRNCIRFSPEQLATIRSRNERFVYLDIVEEAISQRYIPTLDPTSTRKTAREIAREILSETGYNKINAAFLTKIGITLNNMGFKRKKSQGQFYYLVLKAGVTAEKKLSTKLL